jgi:hypothetical protein
MSGKPDKGTWAKMALLLCGTLLLLTSLHGSSGGLRLAVTDEGVSFKLDAAFIKIAFDIGQSCSKTDSCRKMLG